MNMKLEKLNRLVPFVVNGSTDKNEKVTQLAFYEPSTCIWYSERGLKLNEESCTNLNELLHDIPTAHLD